MEYNCEIPPIYPVVEAVFKDGALRFSYKFEDEQEHRLEFCRDWDNGKWVIHKDFAVSVYSLKPDLFCMRPYRGDLHVHTDMSDGRECPESVVANYRAYGYDFMIISDHYRMYPSKEAVAYYKDIPTGIHVYPGE